MQCYDLRSHFGFQALGRPGRYRAPAPARQAPAGKATTAGGLSGRTATGALRQQHRAARAETRAPLGVKEKAARL
eukprot:15276319-Heterocapsa_arctica.AAC.1